MTTTQLISTNPQEAYRKLITTSELDKEFEEYYSEYPMPNVPTSKDWNEATKYALSKMFGA